MADDESRVAKMAENNKYIDAIFTTRGSSWGEHTLIASLMTMKHKPRDHYVCELIVYNIRPVNNERLYAMHISPSGLLDIINKHGPVFAQFDEACQHAGAADYFSKYILGVYEATIPEY
jgi:hypothetical protein